MNYLSVCSGIEAASVAWEPLGWKPVGFSEIEPFPSAVLAHHWPDVPNLGDMTKHHEWPNTLQPDLIVGGTPCQAFSVAGLREGLDDPRGNLTLTFLSIVEQYRPEWVVWENVPGVLSDATGAFGAFLGGLGELGYGFAYRVLDAQYYGVAQRRRRVFVVACLGSWQRAAAVLFERESLRGDSPPSRETGESVAGTLGSRASSGGGFSTDFESSGGLQPSFIDRAAFNQGENAQYAPVIREDGLSDALVARGPHAVLNRMIAVHAPELANTLQTTCDDYSRADGFNMIVHGTQDPCVDRHVAFALGRNSGQENAVVFDITQITSKANYSNPKNGDPCHPLAAGAHAPCAVFKGLHVRRLTPTECERFQGFPDGHTLIPWGKKPADQCPDGPRYKALGNSMAVPVMRWIGERIQAINSLPT